MTRPNEVDMRSVRHRVEIGDRSVEVEVCGYDAAEAAAIVTHLVEEDPIQAVEEGV